MLQKVTEKVVQDVLAQRKPIDPYKIKNEILNLSMNECLLHNATAPTYEKWRVPKHLYPFQIAYILRHVYKIVLLIEKEGDTGLNSLSLPVGIYMEDGPYKGTYITSESDLRHIIRRYKTNLSRCDYNHIIYILRAYAPCVRMCNEEHLIPVNNGIFNSDTKQLMAFTPELVFTSKSKVDYNPDAKNIIIYNDEDGTDWDVESWMLDIVNGDKDKAELIWKVIGATLRPFVSWGCGCFIYSRDYTDKETIEVLFQMMENILGAYNLILLSDFKNKTLLNNSWEGFSSVLLGINGIDMQYMSLDDIAYLKPILAGHTISMYGNCVRFNGFMVQYIAGEPHVKNKFDLFFRNQLYISLEKTFKHNEFRNIKNDYLHRQDVLEYILYRVLNMDYDSFTASDKRNNTLKEYGSFNDYVCQFMEEIMPRLQWDLVPFTFLYDLYNAWYKKNIGDKNTKSKQEFKKYFLSFLPEFTDWYYETNKVYRPKNKMDRTEPLIAEYKLEEWYNPILKSTYTGILRV